TGTVEGASTSTISTISSGTATARSIAAAEDAYFQKNGTYFQVLPNNAVPSYESGTVTDAFGANIPANARIDIYQTPTGEHGYQISYQEGGTQYSIGEGPEANDRFYSNPPEILTATSTPATTATSTSQSTATSSSSTSSSTSTASDASTTVVNSSTASSS